jgi:hypothetical protein
MSLARSAAATIGMTQPADSHSSTSSAEKFMRLPELGQLLGRGGSDPEARRNGECGALHVPMVLQDVRDLSELRAAAGRESDARVGDRAAHAQRHDATGSLVRKERRRLGHAMHPKRSDRVDAPGAGRHHRSSGRCAHRALEPRPPHVGVPDRRRIVGPFGEVALYAAAVGAPARRATPPRDRAGGRVASIARRLSCLSSFYTYGVEVDRLWA